MKLSTDTLAHDVAVRKCGQHNGILPEPRSEREHEFLVNFANGYLFPLGMNDKQREGEWVWESDLSEVVYNKWWKNTLPIKTPKNCDLFYKFIPSTSSANWYMIPCSSSLNNVQKNCAYSHADWYTFPCSSSFKNVSKKVVICQKQTGKWIFIIHRETFLFLIMAMSPYISTNKIGLVTIK